MIMHQSMKLLVLAVLITLSSILCDTRSELHYKKCQEYRVEDETLGKNGREPLVKVDVLGKLYIGITISSDTILMVGDDLNHDVTVNSFKVYLKGDNLDWIRPNLYFSNGHFIVLKMSELTMMKYQRRRACLQSEFSKFFFRLRVKDYDRDGEIYTSMGVECFKQEDLVDKSCTFRSVSFLPTSNNSVVLYNVDRNTSIVGSYVKYGNSKMIKLIDEKNIKWIESVTWNKANLNSIQKCGQVKLPLTPFITMGMETSPGEFPWHAAIYYRAVYNCGGTIINKRTIVTAAHCVQNQLYTKSVKLLLVVVGLYNRENRGESQILQVQSVIIHDDYNMSYYDNDIAILRIAWDIKYTDFVQPICIQRTVQWSENYNAVVPGWGRNEFGNYYSILQKASLYVHPRINCLRANDGDLRSYMTEGNFCAGYENGINVCEGDSGGGLVVKEQGVWVLRGMVSLGKIIPEINKCDILQFVLYTNTTYFYDWIMNYSG